MKAMSKYEVQFRYRAQLMIYRWRSILQENSLRRSLPSVAPADTVRRWRHIRRGRDDNDAPEIATRRQLAGAAAGYN